MPNNPELETLKRHILTIEERQKTSDEERRVYQQETALKFKDIESRLNGVDQAFKVVVEDLGELKFEYKETARSQANKIDSVLDKIQSNDLKIESHKAYMLGIGATLVFLIPLFTTVAIFLADWIRSKF